MNRKKIYLVNIGISAFNEEQNIGMLLNNLLNQKQKNFLINKIILISDGSSDKTVIMANRIENKLITIKSYKTRRGLAFRQNQIIEQSDTEILVLLNADIKPANKWFLYHLVEPIIKKKADLTSSKIQGLISKSFVENIIYISNKFKNNIYESYKNGNNIYTCHGTALAFSKKLYKNIMFKESIGIDAYSYLFCNKNNHTYVYTPKSILFYKLPGNFGDHIKQSERYFNSIKIMSGYFDRTFIEKNYYLPDFLIFYNFIETFKKYPIQLFLYTLITLFVKFKSSLGVNVNTQMWNIATSTKNLYQIENAKNI